jgi:NAD-dependent deacetylase
MEHIVVMTGAGISAESGIKTFRDADGLWEGHDVLSVATPDGWAKNQERVLQFYNDRRRQLFEVEPNAAHFAIAALQEKYKVTVITQNVDDLHERAGSQHVIHLHGELRKSRSTKYPNLIYDCTGDINIGDNCEKGAQLRPHIVWFGEAVPLLELAADITTQASIVMVVGSSMQVYPAAGLVSYAPFFTPILYVDPKPAVNHELKIRKDLTIFAENATTGVSKIVDALLNDKPITNNKF